MRKWVGILATGALLIAIIGMAACTRSKLGPAPTISVTGQPQAQATIPTLTPTPGAESTATSTAEPTSTSQPGATATPTTAPTTGTEFEYTVETGDTLWGIALRFGSTVEAIKARNGLTSDIIYKGQELVIPGTTTTGERITHIVQPGENLFRIALKYGTTVEAIAAANNIVNPSHIYAGQKLIIVQGGTAPSPGTGTRYHVVQPGETLWSIAMRYGTTPWKIAAVNNISNINFIYAGRTLRIP
jgi:LysM repeat protein